MTKKAFLKVLKDAKDYDVIDKAFLKRLKECKGWKEWKERMGGVEQ